MEGKFKNRIVFISYLHYNKQCYISYYCLKYFLSFLGCGLYFLILWITYLTCDLWYNFIMLTQSGSYELLWSMTWEHK